MRELTAEEQYRDEIKELQDRLDEKLKEIEQWRKYAEERVDTHELELRIANSRAEAQEQRGDAYRLKADQFERRLGEVRSDLWGMFAHYAPTVLSKHPNDGWLIAFCQAIEAYIPTIDRAVENPVTIATDRTNERQTCRHCGNPVPCACW